MDGRALGAPVDPASFVVFRVGFGLLAAFAALRFVAMGWVDELLLAPTFHFAWVPWARVPSAGLMYSIFVIQIISGFGISFSRYPKSYLVGWLASFGYVELLDKTLYLNHYVLFTLLGIGLLVTPVHRVGLSGPGLPAWCLGLLRLQLASVYLWAGLVKLNPDWLLRAEPLTTWLGARVDLPVVGPWLARPETAFAMSWGGALYDLSIPFLLLWRRTRPLGVGLVLFFHVVVGLLFPIGIFPLLMVLGATLFLEPDWPRRWLGGSWEGGGGEVGPLGRGVLALVAAAVLLFPARSLLYGPDVAWTERGARFSWRVLLHEKTGMVDFRVVERGTGRTWTVLPSRELTPLQHQHMRTQPDMIRDYALHLRDDFAARGLDVAVYADAWASLDGRPSQRLIDPEADLTRPLAALEPDWIVPLAPR